MPEKKNRITIAQVAEYAQVSTMTVSRVVNNRGQVSEKMRQLVQNAMDELEYKPNRIARSLVSNKTFKIGVIVPDMSSMYFAAILSSIEHVLWEHDYYMVVSNTGKSERREQDVLDVFEQDQVDGVLIFGSHLDYEQLTSLLGSQRAAVVFNAKVDTKVAGQILLDQRGAIETAVHHLISKGRTNLGYAGVDRRTYAMREREQAFRHAISQLGVDGWIMDSDKHNIDSELEKFLSDYPATNGIICFNDELAADVLLTLSRLGKHIPDDIAVVGFDDIQLAQWVSPRLTTFRLKKSVSELGELAAHMLLERIEGNNDHSPVILDHELVIRESTPQ
ncbi:MAG: LacI family DNA-binding transcriptional regulator [Anaerolineaceae bacterium]|nr:LacI family DNA-binding transcriptional regulator [Anaerolineaceae bacterium]